MITGQEILCADCGKVCTSNHWMCDRSDLNRCPSCFPLTACGRGKHGEGCPTQVFEDSQHKSDAGVES